MSFCVTGNKCVIINKFFVGKKWQSRRKVITPAFHFNILEQFAEIFDRNSSILVDIIMKKHTSKHPIDIYPLVNLAALDIICGKCMGRHYS